MMPVIRALAGLTPTATAIPMQRGSATRKTTIEARKSLRKVLEKAVRRGLPEGRSLVVDKFRYSR